VELGLAIRAEKNLKVRQPLTELKVANVSLSSDFADIIAEELNVKQVSFVKSLDDLLGNPAWAIKTEGFLSVAVNLEITEELKNEGLLRDLVRTINQMRKEAGLTIKDRVVITMNSTDVGLLSVIESQKDLLVSQVLAKEILIGPIAEGGKEVSLDKAKLIIKIS